MERTVRARGNHPGHFGQNEDRSTAARIVLFDMEFLFQGRLVAGMGYPELMPAYPEDIIRRRLLLLHLAIDGHRRPRGIVADGDGFEAGFAEATGLGNYRAGLDIDF